jgi:hypothetical protein
MRGVQGSPWEAGRVGGLSGFGRIGFFWQDRSFVFWANFVPRVQLPDVTKAV